MKRILLLTLLLLAQCTIVLQAKSDATAAYELLDRIGGKGASERFVLVLEKNYGTEQFTVCRKKGKPCIKGTSLSAITTGINWYLNHYAHINLAWNYLTTDLVHAQLPLPREYQTRCCNADYRYYLNYCTFGYSMTTWTWERWQQEIDWMALHGINMPLQIVGLECVWRNLLMEDYGYTAEEAENFVAGPAFMAWFGMNNLEGWGASHEQGWYDRQQQLATKILARQRELGMQPVLPGFSGMVPSNFAEKTGIATENQGGWCNFQRPYIMDPTHAKFREVAANYYHHLARVMGESRYYSMDPFHEGGRISSGKYAEGYTAIFNAMNDCCGSDTRWVIQQWQWSKEQQTSLTAVPAKRMIVLDLFSDGQPAFDRFEGYAPQEAIYCAIPNFGGRTGFFGRLPKMADNYITYKQKYATIKGIGAAPEAIEQTPVVYDLLFELPWQGTSVVDSHEWIKGYAQSRYGARSSHAEKAWTLLLESALNNTTSLQGPHEAVVCARPSLDVQSVSTWGGTEIFYDSKMLVEAAYDLIEANDEVKARDNYSYDVVDITRQALTDYAKSLLADIKAASVDTTSTAFRTKRDTFLQLILDLDELCGTNANFRLGKWTTEARNAAKEVAGYTAATQDWYELDNARTLITTWGDYNPSEGGLRDYSYREWQGMLRDFYYPRWQYWFAHGMKAPEGGWFFADWNWAHGTGLPLDATIKGTTAAATSRRYYSPLPEGDTYTTAHRLLKKYLPRVK